jgi:putative amidase-like protein
MDKFQRHRAVQYALRWGLSRNPDFPDYSGENGGGDCANFVSQVMLVGGWTPVWGGKRDYFAWWTARYQRDGSSRSWATANGFRAYIDFSRRASPCAREELDLGDIVLVELDGKAVHTTVVTDIRRARHLHRESSDTIFLSYHSNDNKNKLLSELESYYRNISATRCKVEYWKVADFIPAGRTPMHSHDSPPASLYRSYPFVSAEWPAHRPR